VDANIPPQKIDGQLIEWLRHADREFLVVATKADRVGSRLQASINALKRELAVDEIIPYSAKTGQGQDVLWKAIRAAGERMQDGGSAAD
jgi:GTP-binding protein